MSQVGSGRDKRIKNLAGRVRSGQEFFEPHGSGRVGSDQEFFKSHGSGLVGSRVFNITGRVGSRSVQISQVGSSRLKR